MINWNPKSGKVQLIRKNDITILNTAAAALEKVFPNGFPRFALEHAAVMETSLMLYYYPYMVKLYLLADIKPAEFPPYDIYLGVAESAIIFRQVCMKI